MSNKDNENIRKLGFYLTIKINMILLNRCIDLILKNIYLSLETDIKSNDDIEYFIESKIKEEFQEVFKYNYFDESENCVGFDIKFEKDEYEEIEPDDYHRYILKDGVHELDYRYKHIRHVFKAILDTSQMKIKVR